MNKGIRILFLFALGLLTPLFSQAQINAYAQITAISNGSVLTLSNVNQTFHSFTAGERVIVIQMQGATITGNTANNSSFGIPNSLNSAGLYEVGIIQAVNGGVTSMTLSSPLANTYSTADRLQLVSYRQLGTSGFTTTANITGVAWNGTVGGVVAFWVNGNLDLLHTISANAIGFRGGARAGQNGGGCETATFRIATGDSRYANKGEGVYITAAGEASGRAKAVNGGGGGIVHNGGGGGGGNYTAGGDGYYGYTGGGYCSAGTNAGGQGGLAVSGSASRVFMGGGGGGGQENNNAGSAGGNGGGIILLKADTVIVRGACGALSISANGATAGSGGNDGMGGGGAAGTIVMQVLGIRAITGCPLTISANGGNGGSVGNGSSHGSGGGGAQGAVYISATTSFTNTTVNTNNGAGGASSTSGGAPTAGSGGGSNGSGVITGTNSSPLPIELLAFQANVISSNWVRLNWQTASEINNSGFEVWHLINGGNWERLGFVPGKGTTQVRQSYFFDHYQASEGMNYYKLKQIDKDGRFKMSPIVYAELKPEKIPVKLHPNPAIDYFFLSTEEDISAEDLKLLDATGKVYPVQAEWKEIGLYSISTQHLAKGFYILQSQRIREKLLIE